MRIIVGRLFAFNETGTEGTIPSVQDENHIDSKTGMWSYSGLNSIDPGDTLIAWDDLGNIVMFEESVACPNYSNGERGPFYGWDKKKWQNFIWEEKKAVLIKYDNQ